MKYDKLFIFSNLPDSVYVYMHVYTISPMDSSFVMRTVQRDGMRVHPNFDMTDGNFDKGYDIAILQLSESVDLDQDDENAISAVGLPMKGSTKTYDGALATAVGWGRTATSKLSLICFVACIGPLKQRALRIFKKSLYFIHLI